MAVSGPTSSMAVWVESPRPLGFDISEEGPGRGIKAILVDGGPHGRVLCFGVGAKMHVQILTSVHLMLSAFLYSQGVVSLAGHRGTER